MISTLILCNYASFVKFGLSETKSELYPHEILRHPVYMCTVCACMCVCACRCGLHPTGKKNFFFFCAGSPDHPRYVQPPVIPGHEFIGEVVKIGQSESYCDAVCVCVWVDVDGWVGG